MMKRTKKILVNVLCVVLAFAAMAFSMTGCGKKQSDDENVILEREESFEELLEEDDREDDVQEDKHRDDDSQEESVRAGDSCDIVVGSGTITIDVPLDAEYVHSGTGSLIYDQGSINVEYSDSFCDLTNDAIEDLTDYYNIWANQSDTLSDIKPVETQVGGRDAYYCRAVDSTNSVCYIFFVDIGEEHYLEVILLGPADELSEKKAFELADVDFR